MHLPFSHAVNHIANEKNLKVTILDVITGQKGTLEVDNAWELAENNYSCDCNRNLWNVDTEKEEGFCSGAERFLVVDAPKNSGYTLHELNSDYPKDLLDKFLPK